MKSMILKTNIIAAFLFLIQLATAQNVEFDKASFPNQKDQLKEALSNLKKGDELYEVGGGKYLNALDFYLKAHSFNPNNALLNYKIGVCYLNSVQRTNAVRYFEKAIELNPLIKPDVRWLLGKAYQLNYDFDKAIAQFKLYKQAISPMELQGLGNTIDKAIEECNYAKVLKENPVRVFIDNLGSQVNSIYPDYGPVVNADESVLFFTSRRETTTGGKRDPLDNEFFEDIYISTSSNKIWTSPTNPGKPLNTDSHDAIVGLSPDGQKLLIYKGEEGGDIYECILKGNTWSKPEKLNKTINTSFHESSASLSYDGRTLYFVSDREGGYGSHDIWMSRLNEKGRWGEPVNLGPVINTRFDEDGVFIHPDGKTIYFSSKGHKTMGGADIFKSVFENGQWSEPENLGYPINTPDDDAFFTISASGKHGYYSSVKPEGYGGQDIYMITFLGPEKPTVFNNEDNLIACLIEPVSEKVIEPTVIIKTAQLTLVKGTVVDDKTNEPLKAAIELTDNQKNESLATFESNSATGKYLISLPSGKNYGIAVKADGYLFHSENFDVTSSAAYAEITKEIRLKKVEVGQKIVLNNIFFDTGKSTLKPESYAELGILYKLLTDNPTLKIEISGHTDNVGSATSNQKLSEARAKAVVDYLVSKGIDINRLTYAGYGMTQPIAPNDTKENKAKNRRTEFKILTK